MRLHNFIALPLMTAMFSVGLPYSFPNPTPSTPTTIEVTEEVSSEVLEEKEINPTEVIESKREATFSVGTTVPSHKGITYTQDEVRLVPAMVSICTCESGRQYNSDGSVVKGRVNPLDIGMCQINLKYHGETAKTLGFDLFTEVGNIKYSNYLYAQQGAQPWFWSKSCHGQG